MVVDVLYKHIRQKDKILTSKRVSLVSQDDSSITVECQDGSIYHGSMLVGADGMHSTVGRHTTQAAGGVKQGKIAQYATPRHRSSSQYVADIEARPSGSVSLPLWYFGKSSIYFQVGIHAAKIHVLPLRSYLVTTLTRHTRAKSQAYRRTLCTMSPTTVRRCSPRRVRMIEHTGVFLPTWGQHTVEPTCHLMVKQMRLTRYTNTAKTPSRSLYASVIYTTGKS